ncbi:hypothetical protein T492DRAFT_863941, partial [Pavlovales sp. CCMP2436]
MLSAAGQRVGGGAMHRALTAFDLKASEFEGGAALVRSMSLVSLHQREHSRAISNLLPGSALGGTVYYADAEGGPAPFSVQLEDFRHAGGTSRVCHVDAGTRARDIASQVALEEGMEHAPRLFLDGYELPPDALVCRIARPGSVVLLVPQLTELVSFFIARTAVSAARLPVLPAALPSPQLVVDGTMTVSDVK